MALSWYKVTEGDYAANSKTALYDIEQCGKDRYMAFMNGAPVGVYNSLSVAQTRCETLASASTGDQLQARAK